MKRQARTRPRRRRFGNQAGRGTNGDAGVQYTVRGVPSHVDKALRRRAHARQTSLNEYLREVLIQEAEGLNRPERVHTDLDSLAGAWVDVPGFDEAITAQDRVDEALWR